MSLLNDSETPLHSAARPQFPLTALVGQPVLQRALQLAAIDPGIGGVLISGPRGTAKSTAARALAALLPGAPFVTLPLAASLEQLVGSLNIEDVLRDGRVRLQPGLLARAHQGVLYVDEVNLLPDALIDALLDAALAWLERPGRKLWLGVWSGNSGAQKLYGRRGFVHVPVIDEEAMPWGVVNARDALRLLWAEEKYEEVLLRDYVMGIGYR